jgi:peroxiredoxin
LRESVKQLESRGAQRLTIVANESFWVCNLPGGSSDVPFPVLTDAVSTVSATYGVAFQKHSWNGWTSRQAFFVIDRDGVIRLSWNEDDGPADLLKMIEDLQKKED